MIVHGLLTNRCPDFHASRAWLARPDRFQMQRTLQMAARNQGAGAMRLLYVPFCTIATETQTFQGHDLFPKPLTRKTPRSSPSRSCFWGPVLASFAPLQAGSFFFFIFYFSGVSCKESANCLGERAFLGLMWGVKIWRSLPRGSARCF